ncbi:MAG TPA: ATP-binding protein [Fimbriimonas sp.]
MELSLLSRVPVLVWGPPGAGKSATIVSWAKKKGLPCWIVVASVREPADFGGLPVVDSSSGSVRFAPPSFAKEASERGGLVFLDELTTAPPAVQAALLRAVLDLAFGDLKLDPSRVALVAAANPPEEAAAGWDLAPPLANRFSHVSYRLSVEEWTERFPGYWEEPPALHFGGERLPEEEWAGARSLVAAFVRSRPALLHAMPKDESKRGQAWPSPRSWDFASRLVAASGASASAEVLPLVASCVGDGAAVEFAAWVKEMDLPDAEEILRKPKKYVHPDRKDRAYAVLSAVVQRALARLTEERWLAAWTVLSIAAKAGGADVGAAAARSLARAHEPGLPLPEQELAAFAPMLRAAGMLA